MKFQTLRIILAISFQHDLIIHQMDVVTAFLNGVLDHEVYIAEAHSGGRQKMPPKKGTEWTQTGWATVV
jgi:hypothetical protein